MRQRIHIDLLLMTLVMLVSRTVAQGQGQSPPQGLLAAAEAVVAVEIVSTDYTATAADGPMVAAAKILKVLGEYRILFLEKAVSSEFPRPTDWRVASRQDARTDFFIERDALSDLSLQSLDLFLKRMTASKDNRSKIVFAKGQ
jgi:hypothetical protein